RSVKPNHKHLRLRNSDRRPGSRHIGLAVDAVASYGRGVIRGIMSFCRANPHWVITVEPAWPFGPPPDVAKWEGDGLSVQTFSREFESRVLRLKTPTTNVSAFNDQPNRLPTVLPDDMAVGRMAAEYLLSLGFSHLGFLWPGETLYARLRMEGFIARASE